MSTVVAPDRRARYQRTVRTELLARLVRKDLKVKYQGSALGFVWSLANPLLLMAVYTVVFQVILDNGIPFFGVSLLTGLLVWQFVAGTTQAATGAVVGNAGLVSKVPLPLPVLPLSAVGFAGVHFALQLAVLIPAMALLGFDLLTPRALLLVPALAVALVLATGLAFLVSALNVRYRDTQHLVEVMLMAWFWANPIVYAAGLVRDRLEPAGYYWAYFLNPMAGVVSTFQYALYGFGTDGSMTGDALVLAEESVVFHLGVLGMGAVVAGAVLLAGVVAFRRLSRSFAEDL
jgi:ABC-2 type transport system permease protein